MKEELLIYKLSETIKKTSAIDKELFTKYNVKRGLRNEDHTGVLVGLTRIGDVVGYERTEDGQLKAIPGKLYYRGIDVEELVHGIQSENRLGFEETAFLLLSGYLPTKDELETFKKILNDAMPLQHQATMNIMALKGHDIMNILARCVLEQYIYDDDPDNISRDNLIRQSINLISKFPTIISYAYNVLRHHEKGRSLHIRHPDENFSFA